VTLDSNVLYGGVTGTVLASALLAVVPENENRHAYTLIWIVVSAAVTAATRSYGLHVSTHEAGPDNRFWRDLGRSMLLGWPIVMACMPTLLLVLVAWLMGWHDTGLGGYTSVGLLMNTAQLFGWGIVAASVSGYSTGWKLLIGATNSLLGLVFVLANMAIR
jgi:hypothetical protein